MFEIFLASIIVSILFPIIGCILMWQGRSYFADGLAHTGILAVALSSALSISNFIISPLVALIFAILTNNNARRLGHDVAINVFANSLMAFGIIIASLSPSKVNLYNLFVGDILAVNLTESYILLTILLLILLLLRQYFSKLVILAISRDIAQVQGIKVKRLELIFVILLALILTISMKMMGVILISAILVIPPSAALLVSNNPKIMMLRSVMFSLIAAMGGLGISSIFDVPTSACIVMVSSFIYFICILLQNRSKN